MPNPYAEHEYCQGHCPKCLSWDIDWQGDERVGESLGYKGVCNHCKTYFIEWYNIIYDCTEIKQCSKNQS